MRLGSFGLKAASLVFGSLAGCRTMLFDRGLLRAQRVGVPVIGVGNLSAGGTGKTPLTAFLARDLLARGLRVGLASRGYGSALRAVREVPEKGDPEKYGDEPVWLRETVSGLRVVVGVDRVGAARELAKKVDIILLDDGFQHRWLARDLDLVLIDASAPADEDAVLPLGRWREPPSALARAQALFLTKANLGSAGLRKSRERLVAEHAPHVPVFAWLWSVEQVQKLTGSTADSDGAFSPGSGQPRDANVPVFLPIGVGQPKSVVSCLVQWRPELESLIRERFQPDHHAPTPADIARWMAEAEAVNGEIWLTEKDWVKWRDHIGEAGASSVVIRQIRLRVSPENQVQWTEWWSEALVRLGLKVV